MNPKALKISLRRLAALRAALLALSIELAGLQAVELVSGHLARGLAMSGAAIVLAIVYVFSQPELVMFNWEEEEATHG